MRSQARFVTAMLAGFLPAVGSLRAQDLQPPGVSEPPREVAADGTVSVVVNPPVEPPAARSGETGTPVASSEAAAMLTALLEPLDSPSGKGLHERPLPLLEALERSGDRSRRLWITQAYWKVVAAFAGLRQAATVVERFDLVAPGAEARDRAILDALVVRARAERAEAHAALVTAQQELVDLVRLPVAEPLPWPVDRPLVTAYQTHFETIFATRAATGRVRAINRTLPLRHEAIEARASAVRSAAAALAATEQDHAQGRVAIEAVAAAAERLAAEEKAFIDDVRTYNLEIAEYVMAVADFSVPDERFAAMLIGTPTPWRQPSGIVAAGATADVPAAAAAPAGVPAAPPVFVPPAGLQPAAAVPAVVP